MKYKALLISLLVFTSLVTVSFATPVLAIDGGIETGDPDGGIEKGDAPSKIIPLCNPLKASNITELLVKFVDLAIFIGVLFAVLMFFWIGFKFVMARGNDSALSEAKKWFFYAVIGTAILISSKVIVEVVKNTLTSAGVVNQEVFSNPLSNSTNNCD